MAARLEGRRLVANAKVSAYLLNADHPDGGAKARFFRQFGFDTSTADRLVDALLDHPEINFIFGEIENEFGVKRIVQCNIRTPDGRNPCIRTVWLQEHGDDVHRLVTAIPLKPR